MLLGFYGNGRRAGVVNMPSKGRVEHVLQHASKVHPQIRQELESAYCIFWEKIKYSMGAYAAGGGDGFVQGGRGGGGSGGGSRLAQLSKPDNRIFLGCAAVSTSPAWLEGAVAAAWGTVKSLHDRAMRG